MSLSFQKGFTLIELLVTTCIMLIILVMATTFGPTILARNRSLAVFDQLSLAIQTARSIALNTNEDVILCHSSDGEHCVGAWAEGQLLFVDKDKNGKLNSDDILLQYFPSFKKLADLDWHGFQSDDILIFHPDFFKNVLNGSFIYTPKNLSEHFSWKMVVNRLGRVRKEVI